MTFTELAELIKLIAAVITAIGVISVAVAKIYQWYKRPKENSEHLAEMTKRQESDIKAIKSEQCMITYCMLACLDGLKQLGANGPVTEARDKLGKYINKQAHDIDGD